MAIPHSDPRDSGPTAVLVPLRSLNNGKARLKDALSVDGRNKLIEEMASNVIRAAHDLDVLVVHDDPEVAQWARSLGAATLQPSTSGLNNAVTAGRDHLRDSGYARVIIAHGDLPLVTDLRVMCTGHDIVIAPDRERQGTNVLAVPTALDFVFSYGEGSFDKHVVTSRSLHVEPHILDVPDLAWDVDDPQDLSYKDLEPDEQHRLTPVSPTEDERGADH